MYQPLTNLHARPEICEADSNLHAWSVTCEADSLFACSANDVLTDSCLHARAMMC
jgi:hypothetical protein